MGKKFVWDETQINIIEPETLKHLPGQHNQKRHGWRYSGAGASREVSTFGEPGEYDEFMNRSRGRAGDTARYAAANETINAARKEMLVNMRKAKQLHSAVEAAEAQFRINDRRFSELQEIYEKSDNQLKKERKASQQKTDAVEYGSREWSELMTSETIRLGKLEAIVDRDREAFYAILGDMDKARNAHIAARDAADALPKNIRQEYLDKTEKARAVALEIGRKKGAEARKAMLARKASEGAERDKFDANVAEIHGEVRKIQEKHNGDYDAYSKDPEWVKAKDKLRTAMDSIEMLGANAKEIDLHNQILSIDKEMDALPSSFTEGPTMDAFNKLKARRNAVVSEYNAECARSRAGVDEELLQDTPGNKKLFVNDAFRGDNDVIGGIDIINRMVGDNDLFNSVETHVEPIPEGERASFSGGLIGVDYPGAVNMQVGGGKHTIIHELGHALEYADPGINAATRAFLKRRAGKEELQSLYEEHKLIDNGKVIGSVSNGYKEYEKAWFDKFMDKYMGKFYHSGATEILSMGLALFYAYPVALAKQDPEYFDFIYSVVRMGNI